MSTDDRGYHRGDEPNEVDGQILYPFPETNGCAGCAWDGMPCYEAPRGCCRYRFIWRTGFEAAVQWATRAGKETP